MSRDEREIPDDPAGSSDTVARLLRLAGHRRAIPAAAGRRVHAQVHASWAAMVARRRRRRRWFPIATAALLLLGLAAGLLQLPRAGEGAVIATIAGGLDEVQVERDGRVRPGVSELRVSDRLVVTGSRGGVLRAGNDGVVELRLAPGARVKWTGAHELRLLDGKLYLEASTSVGEGPSTPAAQGLTVLAGAATIRHVGTRYLVGLHDGAVQVAVREGVVRLSSAGTSALLMRGEVGQVSAAGELSRTAVALSPEDWHWAEALALPVPIEGRPLAEVIAQLAGESGAQVEYASPEVERAARTTVLHGPALAVPPQQALDAVIATSGFGATRLPAPDRSVAPGLRITISR